MPKDRPNTMKASSIFPHIHWEVHGKQGPYLLLVHGFLSSRAQWMLNIGALSEVSRPVVVELLGHGRSGAPDPPSAYHPAEYVKAFEEIREHLAAPSWFICGQSLGACLTLRYALCQPHRIRAHVFTNTVAGMAETDAMSGRDTQMEDTVSQILDQGHAFIEKLPMHPANARHLQKDVKAALIKDCANIRPAGVVGTMKGTAPGASVRDIIHQNTVPTLLVCGKREKRFRIFRDFARDNMPHLDILDLDAGHAVNVGAADEFNRAVKAFMSRHHGAD